MVCGHLECVTGAVVADVRGLELAFGEVVEEGELAAVVFLGVKGVEQRHLALKLGRRVRKGRKVEKKWVKREKKRRKREEKVIKKW